MTNTSNTVNAATHYANMFKVWQTGMGKALGGKPSADMLDTIHKLGARPGKQALAIAMGLRDGGVTAGQIQIACGAPQFNKMRGFITDALLKRVAVPKTAEGHTVYKLELTAKGKQRVEREAKRAADDAAKAAAEPVTEKPVKAKAKGKKAPKASATATVTVEPAEHPAAVAAEMTHENGATA